jgi:hypothetical protein
MDDPIQVRTHDAVVDILRRLEAVEEKLDVLMSALQQAEYRDEMARLKRAAKDNMREAGL